MQDNNMLDSSIVTYRDVFGGIISDDPITANAVWAQFKQPVTYPYVSPNLDPAWEVDAPITNTISSIVPWNIYQLTRYSIIAETQYNKNAFFLSEKTAKAIVATRIFIIVGAQHYLKNLRALGFQTFGHIIDESYDEIADDVSRYRAAMDQARRLSQMDYAQTQLLAQSQVDHNFQRLKELPDETRKLMLNLVSTACPNT
jgi:hypothetical protein